MSLMQAARPLGPWRWLGAPALACIVATILFAFPLRLFGFSLPQPVFPMVVAFAWALIRPSVLAPFVLLLLGLFLDLYWGGPMGLWAVSLLVAYASVLASRSIMTGQSPPMRLVSFAAATALAMLCGFLLSSLDSIAFPDPLSTFWQFFATTLLYPFAHRLIERFEDADVRFR
jgi:rod shape-determining protein MreD